MKEFQPRHDQARTRREAGEARGGVPPPQGEPAKPQQERGEHDPLAAVRDILERKPRRGRRTKKQRAMMEELAKIVEAPKATKYWEHIIFDPKRGAGKTSK